jgi:hypothetical protein
MYGILIMNTRQFGFSLLLALCSSAAFASSPECPASLNKNECVYFKEGYATGQDDAKASLTNAYQRHEDSYDSRFESAYSQGYEQGWKDAKKK